jgi:hypothetical protein
MKLSIDTETEEISELRSAIAIVEEAINRRENPEETTETQTTMETPEEPAPQEETPEEPAQEEPAPQEETPAEEPAQEEAPEVDISKVSMSDYGERVENRSMDTPIEAPKEEPAPQDNKTIVKGIIQSLKDKNAGNPIQMQDIVSLAGEKNISEEETRNLVNELQSSSSI